MMSDSFHSSPLAAVYIMFYGIWVTHHMFEYSRPPACSDINSLYPETHPRHSWAPHMVALYVDLWNIIHLKNLLFLLINLNWFKKNSHEEINTTTPFFCNWDSVGCNEICRYQSCNQSSFITFESWSEVPFQQQNVQEIWDWARIPILTTCTYCMGTFCSEVAGPQMRGQLFVQSHPA